MTFIPWNIATLAGVFVGGAIPDPTQFGLGVVFPAAMAGLAVALASGRREVAAAIAGAVLGVGISLAWDPAIGIIAGGLVGPLVAMALPGPPMVDRYPADPFPLGVPPERPGRLVDPDTGR
jgi:predicted branched-subunit amino acid permease